MTAKESEKIVKEMKAYTKKVTASKAKARAFPGNAGICSADGKLTKAYR